MALTVSAVLLVLSGALLGLPALRALGGAGLGGFVVAWLLVPRRWRPAVSWEHPPRVTRGEAAVAELIIRNTGERRRAAFVVVERNGEVERATVVQSLGPGESARLRYPVSTSLRGRIQLGPLVMEHSDPLGLFRSRTVRDETLEVLVIPRLHKARVAPLRAPSGSADLRGLREYVPGDEVRLIHWRTTARLGRPVVREMTNSVEPLTLVVLDTRVGALGSTSFEDAVEVVASVLWDASVAAVPSRLVTTAGLQIDGRSGTDVLDVLAEVNPAEPPVDGLLRLEAPKLGDGMLLWVGAAPPARIATLARRFANHLLLDLSTGPRSTSLRTVAVTSAAEGVAAWNRVAS